MCDATRVRRRLTRGAHVCVCVCVCDALRAALRVRVAPLRRARAAGRTPATSGTDLEVDSTELAKLLQPAITMIDRRSLAPRGPPAGCRAPALMGRFLTPDSRLANAAVSSHTHSPTSFLWLCQRARPSVRPDGPVPLRAPTFRPLFNTLHLSGLLDLPPFKQSAFTPLPR